MATDTQRSAVLDHLLSGKCLTKIEAFELCGTLNLGDIIFNLRKQGYDIRTEMRLNLHTGRYYAEYFYVKGEK